MTVSASTTVTVSPRALDWPRLVALGLLMGLPLLLWLGDLFWADALRNGLAPFDLALAHVMWLRLAVLLIVGWAVPGLLLARAWNLPHLRAPGFYLAAWGLGVCWLMVGALLAHYLPGPLLEWQLWTIYALGGSALALFPVAATARPATPRAIWIGGSFLLAAAVLLRVPGLGYHEFHTDEVVLLRQAGLSIQGVLTALAEHTKGPGEIALTLAVYRALGAIDEGTARLPFALMSVGSALATAWLGYRLFAPAQTPNTERTEHHTADPAPALWIGLWAGLLLLCNGFALGLSRIAQYQPGILLLSALAVWAMWEFAQHGNPRWLTLAGVFSAFGMVLHYEFGVLAPALIWLAILGIRRHPQARQLYRPALLTGLGGAFLVAVAYIPPLLNPYFEETTQTYLSNRLGETLVFNVPFFIEMGTFYNSTYFFFGLMVLAATGIWLGLRAPLTKAATWTLCAWWVPFFILYIFVVRYPGTHFYQMMTAWSLLAAIPLAALTQAALRLLAGITQEQARTHLSTARKGLIALAAASVTIWLAISVFYLYLLFFRQDPEYLVNHEQGQLAFYWAPYPIPEKPRFGFPIHAGWKTIGVLGEWGYLGGTYSSNDRSWGLRTWYRNHLTWIEGIGREQAGGPDPANPESPDYILTGIHIQESNLLYHDGYHDSYHRIGEVRFRDEPRIELWARAPLPVPYVTFHAEDFDSIFLADYTRLSPRTASPHTVSWGQTPIEIADGSLSAELTLDAAHVPMQGWQPGQTVHLTFQWQTHTPPAQDYKLFVHVADAEGRPAAQWDGFPGLNTARTSQWQAGESFADHVLLPLSQDMPRGDYTLLVGLYDPESGARLGDRALHITQISVR